MGYEGVPLWSSDSVAFDLMAQVIGEFDKGKVYTIPPQISGNRTVAEVSKKQGVGCADYYRMVNQQYSDTGLFYWFAVCDEVQRAKNELKRKKFPSVATNADASKQIAKHVFSYGRHMTPEEYGARLDAIDAEDVKRV